MRYYAPYIVAFVVVAFIGAALFHHAHKSSPRDYKYGNPGHERLIQECRHEENGKVVHVARLYAGYSESADSYWYSVTYQKPGGRETQVFASFDTPVIDRIDTCSGNLEMMSGKKKIVIIEENIEGRMKVPLVFYRGKVLRDNFWSADKI